MKVKYGWPADGTDYNMKLVFRIVKADLPEMVDDIIDLTKATPEIQGSANFYCCYELARKGKIDTALRFFNSLGIQQKAECSEKIINIFSVLLFICFILYDDRNCLVKKSSCHIKILTVLKLILICNINYFIIFYRKFLRIPILMKNHTAIYLNFLN